MTVSLRIRLFSGVVIAAVVVAVIVVVLVVDNETFVLELDSGAALMSVKEGRCREIAGRPEINVEAVLGPDEGGAVLTAEDNGAPGCELPFLSLKRDEVPAVEEEAVEEGAEVDMEYAGTSGKARVNVDLRAALKIRL